MVYERYVALGDSSTEGLDDPDGCGGYRGWSSRLAGHLVDAQGRLLYANLAIRGRTTREVHDEQLESALAMQPDLATLFVGTNDVVARRFDVRAFRADLQVMQQRLIDGGATVVSFTLPDMTEVMPLARLLRGRIQELNNAYRDVCCATGALLVPLDEHPVASDPRLWGPDRLHANSEGHARIAAALGEVLGLANLGDWSAPLPELPARSSLQRIGAEFVWAGGWFFPWLCRQALGRSAGDGRAPQRPELVPVTAAELQPTGKPGECA